jgi:hypothetical protein
VSPARIETTIGRLLWQDWKYPVDAHECRSFLEVVSHSFSGIDF